MKLWNGSKTWLGLSCGMAARLPVDMGLATLGFRLAEDRAAGPARESRTTGSEGSDGEVRRNSWSRRNNERCSHKYGSCASPLLQAVTQYRRAMRTFEAFGQHGE